MEKITDLEFSLLELKEEQLEKYEIGNKIEILFKHLEKDYKLSNMLAELICEIREEYYNLGKKVQSLGLDLENSAKYL